MSLQERVFIVGANASGKSNLLDAIRFLRDLAKDGGGLVTAVNERGGLRKIRCLAAKKDTNIEIKAEISERTSFDGDATHKWTYRLIFNQEGGGIRRFIPIIKTECIERKGMQPLQNNKANSYTYLEQPSLLGDDFIDLRKFLSSITYQHLVPQLLRYPHLFLDVGKGDDHFGRSFIEQVNRCNKNTRNSRLKIIQKTLKKFVPGLNELQLEKDTEGNPHLQINHAHWRYRGSIQYEDQFSDGTLRLIGFMWSIMDGAHPLLLEEPELSLHPFIVRNLAEAISRFQKRKGGERRQVIITTHSPEILQKGIALEEIVMLKTGRESTEAVLAKNVREAVILLETGATLAEIVALQSDMPQTSLF